MDIYRTHVFKKPCCNCGNRKGREIVLIIVFIMHSNVRTHMCKHLNDNSRCQTFWNSKEPYFVEFGMVNIIFPFFKAKMNLSNRN